MEYQLSSLMVILFGIWFTLHDKCRDHFDRFWLCKKYPYFKPNWKNRYVKNRMNELVVNKGKYVVKWHTHILPATIDGVHLFKDLMFFTVVMGVYLGWKVQVEFWGYALIMYLFRAITHWVIMHGSDKYAN